MSGRKTTISLDEKLFKEVKETAQELKTSESEVITVALREFLERRKNQRLFDQLNAAYKDKATEEEKNIARSMRDAQRRIAEQEPW